MPHEADITIIGAGVVGLAVAAKAADKGKEVYVLEKNSSFGLETSSRHSGVIHSGIYYPEGSLKAHLCVAGNAALYEICREYNIGHRQIGKLIVAAGRGEVQELEALFERGRKNGARELRIISRDEVKRLEPRVRAEAAIYSPFTGIIDSHSLMQCYILQAMEKGVQFAYQARVTGIEKKSEGFQIKVADASGDFSFFTRILINCAGLYSDEIARLAGIDIDKAGYRLHYCKGEYYTAGNGKNRLVQRLIYPVPSAEINYLGIHVTLDLDGRMRLGPNAYYVDTLDYSIDARNKQLFYNSVQTFLPELEYEDIEPETTGIRPKLEGPGQKFRDYVIREESDKGLPGLINLIGIESPGLTASPAIGDYVAGIIPQ